MTAWIRGKKILLRPMTEKDTENIVRWRNEAFVRENFIYQKPFTAEGHKHWAETMVNTGRAVQFIICTQEEKPVGSVYLRDIDRTHNKAEGYGSEAAELMIRYAFEELQLHKLYLRVLAGNERAKKSYEHAGFVQEGYFRDDVLLPGGYQDVIFMGILNEIKSE